LRTLLQTEIFVMVYCATCGKQNEDSAEFCVDCGTSLYPKISKRRRPARERRRDDGCFGLPHGGAIFGLFIGVLIIFAGLQQLYGWSVDVGPFAVILFGLLIIAGALYGLTRRRS
jgi:hypothetical protein